MMLLLLFLGSVAEILRLLAITKTWNMGTESVRTVKATAGLWFAAFLIVYYYQ